MVKGALTAEKPCVMELSEFGEWKDITFFPGYMISDQGAVFNKKTLRMLIPKPNKYDGKFEVSFKRDNKYIKIPIEWLIKFHFPPN